MFLDSFFFFFFVALNSLATIHFIGRRAVTLLAVGGCHHPWPSVDYSHAVRSPVGWPLSLFIWNSSNRFFFSSSSSSSSLIPDFSSSSLSVLLILHDRLASLRSSTVVHIWTLSRSIDRIFWLLSIFHLQHSRDCGCCYRLGRLLNSYNRQLQLNLSIQAI